MPFMARRNAQTRLARCDRDMGIGGVLRPRSPAGVPAEARNSTNRSPSGRQGGQPKSRAGAPIRRGDRGARRTAPSPSTCRRVRLDPTTSWRRRAQRQHIFTTSPDVIAEARRGDKPFTPDPRYREIRALFPIPPHTLHWVVRQDSDITSLADLAGHSFISGAGAASASALTMAALQALGIERRSSSSTSTFAAAPAALKANQVSGLAMSGSYPVPTLVDLARATPIRLIDPAERQHRQGSSRPTTAPRRKPFRRHLSRRRYRCHHAVRSRPASTPLAHAAGRPPMPSPRRSGRSMPPWCSTTRRGRR